MSFRENEGGSHGSNAFDLRMHHSLFFVNLMSAVEHVADYLNDNKANPEAFIDRISDGFGKNYDYSYVRELRNSVVHRLIRLRRLTGGGPSYGGAATT